MGAVYRMALQLARRPEDASDLVQETYLKALRAADRFEPKGGGIKPWLFKILRNVFYSRLIQDQRTPYLSDALHARPSEEPGPDEPVPAWGLAQLNWEQVDGRLKAAIDHLTPEYREVLLLWAVEGMKYREIGLILEVPIGTVMSRLYRARTLLAQQLGPLASEIGVRGAMDDEAGEGTRLQEPPASRSSRIRE